MAKKQWQTPARNTTLEANLAQYQLFSNSLKGGRFMKNPSKGTFDPAYTALQELAGSNANGFGAGGNSYLRVLPKERQEEYAARLVRAFFPNYCQEVIRVYVATLFQQGYSIEREPVLSALGPEIATNLDRMGRGAQDFLRDGFREALMYGWIGCLTDRPKAPKGGFKSLAEEKQADTRPYSRIILPQNLWDWRIDPVTGDWSFLLIHEGKARTGKGEYEDRWKVWTPNIWAVIDNEGNEIERGVHGLSRIPFDVLVCDPASLDDDTEPFGHSALRDVADLNLEIFQQSSLLEDLLRKTNYPTRVWQANAVEFESALESLKKDGGPTTGAGYDLVFPGSISWIAPPESSVNSSIGYIQSLVQEIRRIAGIATRSEESTEAHSGASLQWEYATRLSLVKLRAENLRNFEVRLWKTYAELLDVDIPAAAVKYPSSYATQPTPQDLADLKEMQATDMPPEVVKDQMKSIVLKRFSHLPDIEERLERIESYVSPGNLGSDILAFQEMEKSKVPQSILQALLTQIVGRYFSDVIPSEALKTELLDHKLLYYTDPEIRSDAEAEAKALELAAEQGSGVVETNQEVLE